MDEDPELDVTLTDGHQVVTFEIAAVSGGIEAWAIREPYGPLTVVVGRAAALEARVRIDRMLGERLAAGWVPVEGRAVGASGLPPTPLPRDLALQLSSLIEALDHGRAALGAADPTGQLWAACVLFFRQARRFGLGLPAARRARAQRERRLGELAEQMGNRDAAILHFQAALAADPHVGVRRRLAQLRRAVGGRHRGERGLR